MTDLDADALGLAVSQRLTPHIAAAVMTYPDDVVRGQLAVVLGRPSLGGVRFTIQADAAGVWLALDVDLTARGGPVLEPFARFPPALFLDLLPEVDRLDLDAQVTAARAEAAASVPDSPAGLDG